SCPISWVGFFFGTKSSSMATSGLASTQPIASHPALYQRLRPDCHTGRLRLYRRAGSTGAEDFRPMTSLPSRMTAIAIRSPGGPEVLVPEERAVPSPGPGEILVKVTAAGVNRPDVMQRQGLYPPPPGASDIPGLEIAGEVVALGSGATRFKTGDKVTALVAGGGYAEYCPVHETNALPAPS